MLHIDNIISQMTDALGYIDMLSTSLLLLQVAIISGNFELAELIKKHRESDTGKNQPLEHKTSHKGQFGEIEMYASS